MKLLALDTSTQSTVLGLLIDEQVIDRTMSGVREHSREILPSIDALLADANIQLSDLDGIIFGRGPGSFTGLRIATGVVQGLAFGLDIPVIPISTMACLAQSLTRNYSEGCVAVAVSARLEEVYFGTYKISEGLVFELGTELVADIADLPEQDSATWYGVGNVIALQQKIEQSLAVRFTEFQEGSEPDLSDLLALGRHSFVNGNVVSAFEAAPVYLREQVAIKSK